MKVVEQPTGTKPTLKTIASMAGLAVPTVSRALSNAPDIGADTKALVRKIAREVGYVPNRAGVRLRTGRTNVISLVMSTEHDMMNHTARLITSLAGGLRNTAFHMIVTPFFPDEDPMKAIRYIVETQSADAVVFNQVQPEDPRVDYLMERGFPFAAHGRSNRASEHAYYDYDNHAFASLGVDALADRGRRSLILVAPPAAHAYSSHMKAGATEQSAARGVDFRVVQRVDSDSGGEAIRAKVSEILKERPETDGIICGSTTGAMACVGAIEANGRVLGKDIDIFSKEALPFLRYFRRDIISVHENVAKAGDFLARAAMQAIKDPSAPPMQMLEVPTKEQITQG
jgi:LacI family transcriptional regulator